MTLIDDHTEPLSVEVAPYLINVTRLLVQLWVGQMPTGIDRVCLAYVAHFATRSLAVVHVRHGLFAYSAFLSRADSAELFERLLKPGEHFRRWLVFFLIKVAFTSWRRPSVRGCIYLNVGHMGIGVDGYGPWLERLGVRPVFFVHDLIPITHSEYCAPQAKAKHVARIENVLSRGVGVITNSRASLESLRQFADKHALPMPLAVPALLGIDFLRPEAASGLSRPIAEPYFVVVSTIEGRKNHLLLLKIWRRLAEQLGQDAPRLVVIGRRGWEAESAMDLLDRCEVLQGIVIEKPACRDVELINHLQHAQALLFPSHIEGFGLPLAEALSLGTPVIASDLAVFREIAHDIPEYIDPLDGMRWLTMVQDYACVGSVSRSQQLARMVGYQPPSWAEHFAIVNGFLRLL